MRTVPYLQRGGRFYNGRVKMLKMEFRGIMLSDAGDLATGDERCQILGVWKD